MKNHDTKKQIEKSADRYKGFITITGLMAGLFTTTKALTYGYMITARFLLCMGILVVSVVMIRYDDELRSLISTVKYSEPSGKKHFHKFLFYLAFALIFLCEYLFVPGVPLIAQGICVGTCVGLLLRCRVEWILVTHTKTKGRDFKNESVK